MEEQKKNANGITLIALVISIIVMLILAGVSLNLTIGENGIIKQAQSASYEMSRAVLEEFLQEKYAENYSKFDENERKVLQLQSIYPEYFFIPLLNNMGSLRYIVDNEGKALYLIDKKGLPKEIRNQLVGGDAGERYIQ